MLHDFVCLNLLSRVDVEKSNMHEIFCIVRHTINRLGGFSHWRVNCNDISSCSLCAFFTVDKPKYTAASHSHSCMRSVRVRNQSTSLPLSRQPTLPQCRPAFNRAEHLHPVPSMPPCSSVTRFLLKSPCAQPPFSCHLQVSVQFFNQRYAELILHLSPLGVI